MGSLRRWHVSWDLNDKNISLERRAEKMNRGSQLSVLANCCQLFNLILYSSSHVPAVLVVCARSDSPNLPLFGGDTFLINSKSPFANPKYLDFCYPQILLFLKWSIMGEMNVWHCLASRERPSPIPCTFILRERQWCCCRGELHQRYKTEMGSCPANRGTHLWTPDRWSFSTLSWYIWDLIKPCRKAPLLISRGTPGSRKLKCVLELGEVFLNFSPDPRTALSLSFRSLLIASVFSCHGSPASKQ